MNSSSNLPEPANTSLGPRPPQPPQQLSLIDNPDPVLVESLARALHEAWLESPNQHTMLRNIGDCRRSFKQISEEARENRRFIARRLISQFLSL